MGVSTRAESVKRTTVEFRKLTIPNEARPMMRAEPVNHPNSNPLRPTVARTRAERRTCYSPASDS